MMKRLRESDGDNQLSSAFESDVVTGPASKIVGVDIDHSCCDIKCSLPGHRPGLPFATYEDYESHYHRAHSNRCLECRRNFPSSHLLDLHIKEFHDALSELSKEKGEPVYLCFVETCDATHKTPAERRAHLIETHKYPTNYFFAVTKAGVDHRQSMLVHSKESMPGEYHLNKPGHRHRHNAAERTGKSLKAEGPQDSNFTKMPFSKSRMRCDAIQQEDVQMGGSHTSHSQSQPGGVDNHADSDSHSMLRTTQGATFATPTSPATNQSEHPTERYTDQASKTAKAKATVEDVDMGKLIVDMSSLKFVPRNLWVASRKTSSHPPP